MLLALYQVLLCVAPAKIFLRIMFSSCTFRENLGWICSCIIKLCFCCVLVNEKWTPAHRQMN